MSERERTETEEEGEREEVLTWANDPAARTAFSALQAAASRGKEAREEHGWWRYMVVEGRDAKSR